MEIKIKIEIAWYITHDFFLFFYGWQEIECIFSKSSQLVGDFENPCKNVISWVRSENFLLMSISDWRHQREVSLYFSVSKNSWFQCLTVFQVFGPMILIKYINFFFFFKPTNKFICAWRSDRPVGHPRGNRSQEQYVTFYLWASFALLSCNHLLPLYYFMYLWFKK